MDVSTLCSELIRFDSSASGVGERPVAEFVAEALSCMGITSRIVEAEPRRANLIARIEGRDRSADALLIQSHLDVVPAFDGDWSVPPFSGEIRDGWVHGRGAVDMKNMIAMTLCALKSRLATGWQPERDIVLAFVADEESGSQLGARYLVEQHPEFFAGCTEAIGEAGGFSYQHAPDRRAYLVQTAEKAIRWVEVTAHGRAGHASMPTADNAVTALADALVRVGRHPFPARTDAGPLAAAATSWADEPDLAAALEAMGSVGRLLAPALRTTVSPTVLGAGGQANVIPPSARAVLDVRAVAGTETESFAEVIDIIGENYQTETIRDTPAVRTEFTGRLADAIVAAVQARDPGATVVPVALPIGTDAKYFSRLGMQCYGFIPLQLPPEFDFAAMFHGVDERVPSAALEFGVGVLEDLLDRQ